MTALATIIGRGLHSARPAAGTAGSIYYETDTSTLFRDNGSTWDSIEGASGGSGTVTSVALTVPSDLSVGGTPVTGAGTLAITSNTQNANLVKAGPSSGSAATPSYRALVAADVPAVNPSALTGSGTVPSAALPVATTSVFGAVKPDGTTITISGGVISSAGGAVSLTYSEVGLTSDVLMNGSGVTTDVFSLSLAAGTYLVIANVVVKCATNAAFIELKLWDGTTVYDQAEGTTGAAAWDLRLPLHRVIVLTGTTTIKVSGQVGASSQSVSAAAVSSNSAGNFASRMTAVKIA